MNILLELKTKGMTIKDLSVLANVPYTTVRDIVKGKSNIADCSFQTVYRMAEALDVNIEDFIETSSFDNFKSNVCHEIKRVGDLEFIKVIFLEKRIDFYLSFSHNKEALYLLSMIDYLSRKHNIPLYTKYEKYRHMKLQEPVYPNENYLKYLPDDYKKRLEENAIPEFLRANIIEGEINVDKTDIINEYELRNTIIDLNKDNK